MKKNIILLVAGGLLIAGLFGGCTVYTGITVKDKKVILSNNDGTAEICSIGGDGMLENCRTN